MPSGKTISSGFLLDATYEILLTYRTAVKDFCLIQTSRSEVVLEVVTGEGWSADVRRAIEGRFRRSSNPACGFRSHRLSCAQKQNQENAIRIISRIEH